MSKKRLRKEIYVLSRLFTMICVIKNRNNKAQEEDKIKNPVKDTNPLGNQQPKSKTDKSIQLRLKHLRASLTRMPVEIK